eukprot:gene16252-11630_t
MSNMSPDLQAILGFTPQRVTSDWKPPSRPGLDNSVPIVDRSAQSKQQQQPPSSSDRRRDSKGFDSGGGAGGAAAVVAEAKGAADSSSSMRSTQVNYAPSTRHSTGESSSRTFSRPPNDHSHGYGYGGGYEAEEAGYDDSGGKLRTAARQRMGQHDAAGPGQ